MNKGFSLVELIVVIAIMAILVGVAVPVYTSYIEKANKATDIQAIDNLNHACEIVALEYDVDIKFSYSKSDNTLTATIQDKTGSSDEEAAKQLNKILGFTAESKAVSITVKTTLVAQGAANTANDPQVPDNIGVANDNASAGGTGNNAGGTGDDAGDGE